MALYGNVEEFRADTISIGEKNNYCDESKVFIANAKSFEELLAVGKLWFPTAIETGWFSKEVLMKVNPILRKRAEIFINESFDKGYGLITEGSHVVSGNAQVFVIGKAQLTLKDNARARVFGEAGCKIIASDRSKVISNGEEEIESKDFVFVRRIGAAKVTADGNSAIYSVGKKNNAITLLGSSTFKQSKKN